MAIVFLVAVLLRTGSETSLQRQNSEQASPIALSGLQAAAVLRAGGGLLQASFGEPALFHFLSVKALLGTSVQKSTDIRPELATCEQVQQTKNIKTFKLAFI